MAEELLVFCNVSIWDGLTQPEELLFGSPKQSLLQVLTRSLYNRAEADRIWIIQGMYYAPFQDHILCTPGWLYITSTWRPPTRLCWGDQVSLHALLVGLCWFFISLLWLRATQTMAYGALFSKYVLSQWELWT